MAFCATYADFCSLSLAILKSIPFTGWGRLWAVGVTREGKGDERGGAMEEGGGQGLGH